MRFTPSTTGSVWAGAGLWLLAWSFIFKMDAIAKVFHLDGFVNKNKLLDWTTEHKGVSLIATEAINIGSHGMGMDPLGVTFSVGGTIVNAIVIFLVLPVRKLGRTLLHKDGL